MALKSCPKSNKSPNLVTLSTSHVRLFSSLPKLLENASILLLLASTLEHYSRWDICVQSYKGATIVNYNSRVVVIEKL